MFRERTDCVVGFFTGWFWKLNDATVCEASFGLVFSRIVFYFLGFLSESQILNDVSKELNCVYVYIYIFFLASLNGQYESSNIYFLLAKFFFVPGLKIRSILLILI